MGAERAHSVLIVEDERIVAKDLQQTLAGFGYDAFAIASSADEAISQAAQKCPDVVLMDIRIKGNRDGIETAEILKDRFGVPVVYLTAHADEATIERAKRTTPHGYLLKPVKSGELRSAIEVSLYRAEMEKRLRERERWYLTTLRSISDAVISVDLSGNITFMNPVAEALTGMTLANALGQPAREVLRLVTEADHPLERALRERRPVTVREATLRRESDGPLVINDTAAPVVDDDELLGAVMIFRDVTAQKAMEKQLELADRLASLGTMAAGVAHEINNPLTSVVGNADFMIQRLERLREEAAARGAPATPGGELATIDEVLEAQREVQSAAVRIARIVADLKSFARPAPRVAGQTSVSAAIDWALRTTASQLRHRARVVVDLAEADELPPVRIDETKLGQVLVNLLVNAAQAIAPGHPDRNQINITGRLKDPDRVEIEIRDTGCGMPPDILSRVFEPFFTTKPIGEGTGLGLSVCHGIVTSAGGALEVTSQVGTGTTFRLTLPTSGAAPPANKEPLAAPAASDRRKRLLVVDDEEAVLRVIGRALDRHDVVATSSPEEAAALLRAGESFDAILCDLMMPNMSGIDLYEQVLSTRPETARRIIFMTGGALTARAADFLRTVPNARLEKPFDTAALTQAVEAVTEREGAPPSAVSRPRRK